MTQFDPQANDSSPWYVVQCRAGQNERALQNLKNQGIPCFNPQIEVEKLRAGKRIFCVESLFPGYVFVQLDQASVGWHSIRSTRGAQKLVAFGGYPVPMPDDVMAALLNRLRQNEAPVAAFKPGDKLHIVGGPFANLEALFHTFDGQERVVVLLNLLNKQQKLALPLEQVKKH